MKYRIFFLSAFAAASIVASGQGELGVGYAKSTPQGLMSRNVRSIDHFVMDYGVRLRSVPLYLGAEAAFGSYGRTESDQWYEFPDGTGMLAPVAVSNSVSVLSGVVRYELPGDFALKPYAQLRGGMSRFGTRLMIEDPRAVHTNDCPLPLENEVLKADRSWFTSAGLGLRLDLGSIFKKSLDRDMVYFDFSANYVRGTTVDYMSVNPPDPTVNVSGHPEFAESVTLDFASAANPEVIHKYHTGYLYRSPMELIDYRFRLVLVLPNL